MKQISVNFDEHSLVAFLSEQDDKHMVAIKPICEALGLNWATQFRKLERDQKFSSCHMAIRDSAGRHQETICIPVDEVAGFLYSINSRKVSEEVAPKLLKFQKKLQVVMHEAVTGKVSMQIINEMREIITELKQENKVLRQMLGNQQQTIDMLVENQETQQELAVYTSDEFASDAGRALSRHRKVKQIASQYH